MPLYLRNLTLTKEEAAIIRVALSTTELKATLSPEGRKILRGTVAKVETVLDAFPKGA